MSITLRYLRSRERTAPIVEPAPELRWGLDESLRPMTYDEVYPTGRDGTAAARYLASLRCAA
jgi:hypothetical protein